MVRILWINPVGTDAYDAPIGDELRAEAAPTTRVDVCSLPGIGPQHLEWNALEAVVAGPTMGVIRWASEQQGYDAAVIGCFYDPFLRGARELAGPMAVTAPAEACLRIAATVGERVSIWWDGASGSPRCTRTSSSTATATTWRRSGSST